MGKNTQVKVVKGTVTPLWLLAIKVLWFILANVLKVAVLPAALIHITAARGIAVVDRKLKNG